MTLGGRSPQETLPGSDYEPRHLFYRAYRVGGRSIGGHREYLMHQQHEVTKRLIALTKLAIRQSRFPHLFEL